MTIKTYSTPPHLYLGFQPPNLEQFSPMEALRAGTLWKVLYDPYFSPHEAEREGLDSNETNASRILSIIGTATSC